MKNEVDKKINDSDTSEPLPNEEGHIELSSFIKITDPNTGEVLLNKRCD